MGALNSTLSPDQIVQGGTVAVAIAASAYYYAKKDGQASKEQEVEAEVEVKEKDFTTTKKPGKNKKRAAKLAEDGTPAGLAASAALFEDPPPPKAGIVNATEASGTSSKARKKRTKKAKAATNTPSSTLEPDDDDGDDTPEPPSPPVTRSQLAASTSSVKSTGKGRAPNKFSSLTESQISTTPSMDASWTHVGRREKNREAGSDAGMTTSEEQSSSAQGDNSLQALADKLGAKQPKTAVDDMLPPEPRLGRVLRVASQQEDDLMHSTDADDAEEGWGIVKRRGTPRGDTSSTPIATPPPEPTKDQRRREAKKEATKAAKADAEADRLATLAKHKKEQEKDRIAELLKKQGKGSKISGGMKAVVGADGRLVWE